MFCGLCCKLADAFLCCGARYLIQAIQINSGAVVMRSPMLRKKSGNSGMLEEGLLEAPLLNISDLMQRYVDRQSAASSVEQFLKVVESIPAAKACLAKPSRRDDKEGSLVARYHASGKGAASVLTLSNTA